MPLRIRQLARSCLGAFPLIALMTFLSSPGPAAASGAAPISDGQAKAGVQNWLTQTNKMWRMNDFSELGKVTTGEMQAVYLYDKSQLKLSIPEKPFHFSKLSVVVPCETGATKTFVAYADTDVFTFRQGIHPYAMVFEKVGGTWKLAAVEGSPTGKADWPALCTGHSPTMSSPVLTAAAYTSTLAPVLTKFSSGIAVPATAAAPFDPSWFTGGSDSIQSEFSSQFTPDEAKQVALTVNLSPAAYPTFAWPLATGDGYWVVGSVTQTDTHDSPVGITSDTWPDGAPVDSPSPTVVHHQVDTFITSYAAVDPLSSSGSPVQVDAFYGSTVSGAAS